MRRGRRQLDIWPGFVDALAALLLVFLFVLLIFALSQYFLTDRLADRDETVAKLEERVAALSDRLADARTARERTAAELLATHAAREDRRAERDAARKRAGELAAARDEAQAEAADQRRRARALERQAERLAEQVRTGEQALSEAQERTRRLEGEVAERDLLVRAEREEVRRLNARVEALNRQLDRLNAALEAERERVAAQRLQLDEMGRELNRALTRRVEELERYRSEFFGHLRDVLDDNPDIRVVGDRFVFQSRIFFETGSATLGDEGRNQLQRLADTLHGVAEGIPDEMDWVLRVDGHADRRPIQSGRFVSNRELSSARALAIVRYLEGEGIPPERLVAAGFGSHHPLVEGTGPEVWARNRRIEFKLTRP